MLCVILHSQHCLEEKTQNFTRARQSSTRQVDVLCEARRCSSSYKCSAGNTYAELQTRTKQVWEADYVIRTQLFRCEKKHQKKENCLVENAHVILHLQHCLEEKTQNFTRARQSSTRQVDVLCEARRCSSSYKCSAGNTYAELQTRTKQVWEADYVIRTQLFRCEKNHQKKENCLVENACVILHLQHCLEEKTQNFTRARQSSTRQVDVLCEARRCSSSYKCSAGNTYAELQARTKQVWEADYVIRTQLFRCEKTASKKRKLFSGKCSRYFTPSALPRREDPKFHARASVFNATSGRTV